MNGLPIFARGCFLQEIGKDNYRVAVRGYDKFFNIGENDQTNWEYIERNCPGPYEVTLKENGCIIFISSVDGILAVTSKHALGDHAEKAREWLKIHLQKSGKTESDLSSFLAASDITAVFEVPFYVKRY
jgi:tRNA ligase